MNFYFYCALLYILRAQVSICIQDFGWLLFVEIIFRGTMAAYTLIYDSLEFNQAHDVIHRHSHTNTESKKHTKF